MLAVIDYGGGNLGSLLAALRRHGAAHVVTGDATQVEAASSAILPGDGAFGATMRALRLRGLDGAIRTLISRGAPFLGICVGMQVLFKSSQESPGEQGLGVFRGTVARFSAAPRVPHMGWNQLELTADHPFVRGVGEGEYVYFLHSYRAGVGQDTIAATTHGERFSAVVARENLMGTQFHPEKSQRTGARLLENFLSVARGSAT